jgi:hypothetical protein
MTLLFARFWTWIDDRFDITYRPERHFMRGPGPKTLRRQAEEAQRRAVETIETNAVGARA